MSEPGGQDQQHYEELLGPYCFGDLTEIDRALFEAHLLTCDICWAEVRRLELAIRNLRSDRSLLTTLNKASAIGILGLSQRLDRLFGSHFWHVVITCILYAALYAVSLTIETAYDFAHFGTTAVLLAVLVVFPVVCASSLLVFWIDWKRTAGGDAFGLAVSIAIISLTATAILGGLTWFLPDYPITRMVPSAYPARMAYLKDISYYVPFMLVFVTVPFHFVISAQRELQRGNHRSIFSLLAEEKSSVSPRGALFLKVRQLGLLLAMVALLSIYLTTNLFDHLIHDIHTSRFMLLIQIRNFLYFSLGVEALVWYSRSLDTFQHSGIRSLEFT